MSSTAATLVVGRPERVGRRPGPGFWFVAPAVFMLILIGLLPFVWSVVVSFQNLAGANRAGSFVGFANYLKLWHDARLWAALGRTFAIMAVALPLQLVLGLLLALHFQSDRPLKKLFVALLVLPAVISPMVAGSMWRLMFDQKFGPMNQIISWFTGEADRAAVDRQVAAAILGDHHRRSLAVDAVHVRDPARGAGQRGP